MASATLQEEISTLNAEQREYVMQFIIFLKGQAPQTPSFLAAAQQFMDAHPELLRRLAQ